MKSKWSILLYSTKKGTSPVKEFILSLDLKNQAKIKNTLNLLQEFGIQLSAPHVKKITGTNLWEIRILGKSNIRIFYITITKKTFILLHGFLKKSNKTPVKEINIAVERSKEFTSSI